MSELSNRQELTERLSLIESMIAEGRQSTERWGWTFVLWGIAYYTAIAWARWGNPAIAWPVTMVVAGLITAVVSTRRSIGHPDTTLGRSIASIWIASGLSLFLFGFGASLSGHLEQHTFLAVICTLLGSANGASGILLRWKAQFAAALVWWATAGVALFGSVTQGSIAFLAAIFLGQIVFGIYMMISEAHGTKPGQARSTTGASHA